MRQNECTIKGVVSKGRQVGRTLGFPTANLYLQSCFPILDLGVYGVKVFWRGNQYYGAMNVGFRPTFEYGHHVSYEIHLLDFHEDLYDEELIVDVCFYVRQEKKFSHLNELKGQLYNDVAYVKKQFGLIETTDLKNNFGGRVDTVEWPIPIGLDWRKR
ncbi:Riboflavin kinase [Peribacillus simplex]|uniref:riboflavin kinase n=1 Tax=Peribacillus simplex TaxID=1478 RepID=A0A9X8WMZ7_9BACI|nr:riboflavin kinase [Peribacillus simplex]SIS03963.1 Riboflavin kinase [Peribacillus simplex]